MAKARVRLCSTIALSTLVALSAVSAAAQVNPATAISFSGSHKTPQEVKDRPMPMTAPLFLESETYTSTLYLVNQLNFGVQANVTVYDVSGAMVTTVSRYMNANSELTLSVRKLLAEGGFFTEVGSIEVVSPQNSHALLGQLSITRTGQTAAYLDEELFMPMANGSRSLRAVIDSPQNSPIVSLTNVSSTLAEAIQTQCISSGGAVVTKKVNLQPKQMKLVRACSTLGDTAFSPDDIDSQFVLTPESSTGMSGQRVAGVSITWEGPPGELAAYGFVEHADAYGNYFSAMNFADPGLLNSTATVFTGVPVGPSAATPGSAYTPQVALTNFSDLPQTATIYFATTTAEFNDSKGIAQITIPGNSSRFVDLSGTNGSPYWQNSFVVRSSGQPGDVLSKMMFKTAGVLPNVELIGKDEQDMHNAGDHPWNIENGMVSTLYLFNHGDSTRKVGLRIGSASYVWLKLYDLRQNETKANNLVTLIQQGVPDDKGYVFPRTITHGEISWWAPRAGPPEVSGRVVQVDPQGLMARNFSCGASVGICAVQFANSYDGQFQETIGSKTSIPANPQYCVYDLPQEGACPTSNESSSQFPALTWQWSVQNTNIAMISSGATTPTAVLQGVSSGTTSFTVNAAVNSQNYCSAQGSMNVTGPQAPVPTSMQVLYDPGNTQTNICSQSSQNGEIRNIQYQTLAGSVNAGSYQIQESFGATVTSTCNNKVVYPTSKCSGLTNSSGAFTDTLATNYCSTTPNNGCGFAIKPDQWQVCPTGVNGTITTFGSPNYVVQWKDVQINGSVAPLSPGTPIP